MPELPNDAGVERIKVIYSRLETVWHGLEGCSEKGTTVEGTVRQHQETLTELKSLTGKNYDSFMPHTWETDDLFVVCLTRDLRTQTGSLMGELRPEYLPGQVPHFVKETQPLALTNVSQYVNQEVNVTQNLIIDIALKLEGLEAEYDEGSPERNFITVLKEGLKTVKDFASLLYLIITTAKATGIDYGQLHTILKALHLG